MLEWISALVFGGALAYIYVMILGLEKAVELLSETIVKMHGRILELENEVKRMHDEIVALYISDAAEEVIKEENTTGEVKKGRRRSRVKGKVDGSATNNTASLDDSGEPSNGTGVIASEGDKH